VCVSQSRPGTRKRKKEVTSIAPFVLELEARYGRVAPLGIARKKKEMGCVNQS